jgi:hypothetical protein
LEQPLQEFPHARSFFRRTTNVKRGLQLKFQRAAVYFPSQDHISCLFAIHIS